MCQNLVYIPGYCKCGSKLKATIMQLYDNDQRVTIHCKATNGDGNCGKRQCRGDDRKNFVAALKYESVESYRIKQADKMMIEGDSHEPPHLYTSKVMRNAKYEARMQEYRDPNPITAICKFKRTQEDVKS